MSWFIFLNKNIIQRNNEIQKKERLFSQYGMAVQVELV